MRKKFFKRSLIICLLLLATIAIAVELGVMAASEMSVSSANSQLMGVQTGDETNTVAEKTRMNKQGEAGKKAAKSLGELQKEKNAQYEIMNAAMGTQKDLYKAQRENNNSQAKSLTSKLKKQIPEAKAALKKLRSLTDEEINIIKATTKNQKAIEIAESNYNSWKAGVDALKVEPLNEKEMKQRDREIKQGGDVVIKGAEAQAKSIKSEDLSEEDKTILKQNVVGKGRNVMSDIVGIMQNMQSIMGALGGATGSSGGSFNPLDMMGSVIGGTSNKAPVNDAGTKILQLVFQNISGQMQSFMGSFGPFMQTVGGLVGESVDIPVLSGFKMP